MSFDLYNYDIRNRFFGVRIRTESINSLIKVTARRFGNVVAEKTAPSELEGIVAVRGILLQGADPLLTVTTTQRNRSDDILDGQVIFNTSTNAIQTYINGKWE